MNDKKKILDFISKHTYFSEDIGVNWIDADLVVSIIEETYSDKSKKIAVVDIPSKYTNINVNAFNEWMAYKKYKNKGAITKTLNMLNKYDYQTQQEMVDKSIMNEYKGLFEPKQKRSNTQDNVNVAMSWLEENQDTLYIGDC